MQNFDDLDIEGRNPSHLSEEEREKVNPGCKKKIHTEDPDPFGWIVLSLNFFDFFLSINILKQRIRDSNDEKPIDEWKKVTLTNNDER